jgi:hypothetical protein
MTGEYLTTQRSQVPRPHLLGSKRGPDSESDGVVVYHQSRLPGNWRLCRNTPGNRSRYLYKRPAGPKKQCRSRCSTDTVNVAGIVPGYHEVPNFVDNSLTPPCDHLARHCFWSGTRTHRQQGSSMPRHLCRRLTKQLPSSEPDRNARNQHLQDRLGNQGRSAPGVADQGLER